MLAWFGEKSMFMLVNLDILFFILCIFVMSVIRILHCTVNRLACIIKLQKFSRNFGNHGQLFNYEVLNIVNITEECFYLFHNCYNFIITCWLHCVSFSIIRRYIQTEIFIFMNIHEIQPFNHKADYLQTALCWS